MNDFTKEELNDLNVLLCLWVVKHPEDIGTRELQKKIQAMIDNYTELKPPDMANYCCGKCNEEWHRCECKNE